MHTRRIINLSLTALAACCSTTSMADDDRIDYPETRRVDHVDEYHGVKVPDPYRWLEEDPRTSDEVAQWIEAQNKVTRAFLDAIPKRDDFRDRLRDIWNFERYSPPEKVAGRYFWFKNDGLQNQPVLYHADRFDADGEVLIDPNQWSADGTIALGQVELSDDGRLAAYTRQEAGSDWSTIHVVEVESGNELSDEVKWSRHGNIVWNAAGDGFYYARYPEPPEDEKFQAPSLNQMIYFHRLGQPQTEDKLVYRRPDHPQWSFWLTRTDDDRYLVLSVSRSTDPQNMVLVRPVDADGDEWTPLVNDFENEFSFVGNEGPRLIFLTDLDAATKRLVSLDAERPGREHAEELVPAADDTLAAASLLDHKLVCQYLADVATRVEVFSADGKPLGEVELPGLGSADGFSGKQTDSETFFSFTSYTTPPSIYRLDVPALAAKRIRAPRVKFEPDEYELTRDFYEGKDGERIPIMIAHRRGVERNGKNPTLLYGYGGFNISITPAFSVEYAVWMEMGGVVAVANLRGGGEYGEAWHQAGKKTKKQTVFDDFIAAARWLVDQKYASSEKLAIAGGSNGGLLVGAAQTQEPQLFGACLPAVGVMDMLRFHKFTAGHFWVDEYGSADDPEEFKALRAYSPYHNTKPGTEYPATLITTADTDDRVVPLHSFKYAAALQHAQAGDAPILLRVETRAGHGAGMPTDKRIDLAADRLAFLWKALGMED